jgi:aryl-alcohol dehydrogenase-like predicted oxidoreductase
MEYRLLGSSGCAVSALALGTLTFGNETDQETAFGQLDAFTEAGGMLVDSADVYADGRSEEIIGRWLADRPGRREQVVLATKGRFPPTRPQTGTGCRASTWRWPSTRRCAGWAWRPSTCTRSTAGTR